MNAQIIFVITLLSLLCIVIFLQVKYDLLKDNSTDATKPYSFARTQLVWWTFLVLSAIIAIILASGSIPTLSESTLILLGIGSLTTISARLTDISDYTGAVAANPTLSAIDATKDLSRNQKGENFILDILSDKTGISVHRLQAVLFNFVFGLWFVYEVWMMMKGVGVQTPQKLIDSVIPSFETKNLVLLGLSAGTYAALKTTENKPV